MQSMILRGVVERGESIARTLGAPTANIAIEQGSVIPGFGVYVGRALVRGQMYNALVCVHHAQEKMQLKMEVHVLGQEFELLGESLEVTLLEKMRDLVPWPGVEKMKAMIVDDLARAQAWFLGRTF